MTPGIGMKSRRSEAIAMHRDARLSIPRIADELGVGEATVRGWLWPRSALPPRKIPAHDLKNAPAAPKRPGAGHEGTSSVSSSNYRGTPGVGQPSARTQAVELRKQGVPYQRIADVLGVSYSTVYRWINGREQTPVEDYECPRCGRRYRRRKYDSKKHPLCQSCGNSRKGKSHRSFKDGLSQTAVYRVFNLKLKGEANCRNCGQPAYDLHHAIPRSMCRAAIRELRNGLPLCRHCHNGWHRRCVTIYRDIFTREEWSYISSVELLGQSIQAWLDDRYPVRPTSGVGWPE